MAAPSEPLSYHVKVGCEIDTMNVYILNNTKTQVEAKVLVVIGRHSAMSAARFLL